MPCLATIYLSACSQPGLWKELYVLISSIVSFPCAPQPLSLAFAPSVCSANDLWSSEKPFSLPTSADQASLHLSPTHPPPYAPGSVWGHQRGRNFHNFLLHGHISTYIIQKDVCFICLFFSEIEPHCAHYFAISFFYLTLYLGQSTRHKKTFLDPPLNFLKF